MNKLNALTSLRFFAAILVVIDHSVLAFFVPAYFPVSPVSPELALTISFFFILSGFVLTYIYPILDDWRAVKKFWVARAARVWPLHLFGLVFLFMLLPPALIIPSDPSHSKTLITISNVLLFNAWIPFRSYVLSYNFPSWSLAADVLFYILFPFLIFRIQKNWPLKLLLLFLLTLTMIYITNHFQLPSDVLIYSNPASRAFEFGLGMVTALVWRNIKFPDIKPWLATCFEVILFLSIGFGMHYFTVLQMHPTSFLVWIGDAGRTYLFLCAGMAPIFCILILFMSANKGYIARFLNYPLLVKLGDISFGIYIMHFTLFRFYICLTHSHFVKNHHIHIAPWLAYIFYWIVLLGISYFACQYIEQPWRDFIVKYCSPKKKSAYPSTSSISSSITS